MPQVHGRHHDAHPGRTLAFESVKHRQQVAIEPALLAVFKDGIGIVDKDHRRGIILRGLKNPMDALIEIVRARDERAINQEELATETVSERAAYCRFARAWGPVQQHSALWPQPQFRSQGIITERQRDMNLEASHHIVHPPQIV